MSDQPLPLAGWYSDPSGAPQQRYWDGTSWSDHTAPRPGANAAPVPGGWPSRHGTPSEGLPDYYARAFAEFDTGGSQIVWNWAAFLLGALWYLYRGMWAKALIYAAIAIFSGGFLIIPLWIYAGLRGTYDLYLLRRTATQLWS
jgi:hypothetical protein